MLLGVLRLTLFAGKTEPVCWLCPVVFCVFSSTVVWMRGSADALSGLSAGLVCSGMSGAEITVSKFFTAISLMLLQAAVYCLIMFA